MRRLFIIIGLLLLPSLVKAQGVPVHWDTYAYRVEVQRNGDLAFTETQTIVVDRGPISRGNLTFKTGEYGAVRDIRVAEDGQAYQRGSDKQPGTYNGVDNGEQAVIEYYFRDPTDTRHAMTISYVVTRALRGTTTSTNLDWNFFCSGNSCPRIQQASLVIKLPGNAAEGEVSATTRGFAVRPRTTASTITWEQQEPAVGTQLGTTVTFPARLVPNFNPRTGAASNPNPGSGSTTPQPAPSTGLTFSPIWCVLLLFIVFIMFNLRRTARQPMGFPPGGPLSSGPLYGRRRRGWGSRWGGGIGGWGWGGGWGGGWGAPPPPMGTPPDLGGNRNDHTDGGAGGTWNDSNAGGSTWGDSGGGGSSWTDSSASGSSWSDLGSSGGGSTWSDSGSSWGGGGGDSGSSGGGSDNSSSFS